MRSSASMIVLAALWLAGPGSAATARTLETEYSLSVRGLPVGTAELKADFQDGRYTIGISTRTSGLIRIFSDGNGSAEAIGRADADGLRPAEYGHRWTEEGDTESVHVEFAGVNVKTIAVDPPVKRPQRYVPVTAEHKRGVLDPASAFVWPASGEGGPQLCRRVLRLFDGKRRFDLSFAFSRMENFRARDGSYSGPAFVCSMRYTPISGHRAKKDSVRAMAENTDMEIWMAPTSDGRNFAPVKVRVGTEYGRVVLEAKRFASQ